MPANGLACCFWTIVCLVEMLTTAGCSFATMSAKLIGAPARGRGDRDRAGLVLRGLRAGRRLERDRGGGAAEEKGGGQGVGVTHEWNVPLELDHVSDHGRFVPVALLNAD